MYSNQKIFSRKESALLGKNLPHLTSIFSGRVRCILNLSMKAFFLALAAPNDPEKSIFYHTVGPETKTMGTKQIFQWKIPAAGTGFISSRSSRSTASTKGSTAICAFAFSIASGPTFSTAAGRFSSPTETGSISSESAMSHKIAGNYRDRLFRTRRQLTLPVLTNVSKERT